MAYFRVFLAIVTISAMAAALVISLMTFSLYPAVLAVTIGWIGGKLLDQTNLTRSTRP